MKFNRLALVYQFVIIMFFIGGCNKVPSESSYTYEISKFRHFYLALHQQISADHYNSIVSLSGKTNQFASIQNINFFEPVRDAWKDSWRKYQLLQPFYYMNSNSLTNPIDYNKLRTESFDMNIEYIDATQANPNSGIIMNPSMYPVINSSTISSYHSETTDNKTIGYQVIEFILWGEDLSTSSGGTRTHYDFNSTTETTNRRRAYLSSAVSNLHSEFSQDYSASFENDILLAENEDFMKYVLGGIIHFTDVYFAENGLNTPYLSQNTSDEISEFSENTITDLNTRLDAIEMFLTGIDEFDAENQYFLIDFIRDVDVELSEQIKTSIHNIRSNIDGIQGFFDNALSTSSERLKINQSYLELKNLTLLLNQFAKKISVEL